MHNMDTNSSEPTAFSSCQFLADSLNVDLGNEETFVNFMQSLCSNANYFATQTKNEIEDFFSQFVNASVRIAIYSSLAENVLIHFNLKNSFKCKERILDKDMYLDIHAFFQLLVANENHVATYNLASNFDKVTTNKSNKNKNHQNPSEVSLNLLLEEIRDLKTIINNQSNLINQIKLENKEFKNELLKITQKVDGALLGNRSAFSFSLPPPMSTLSNNNSTATSVNVNNTQASSLFSNKVAASIAIVGTPSGTKRPLSNQNNNSNKFPKPTPNAHSNRNNHQQRQIKNFNSFNPDSENSIIDLNDNDGYTTVTSKKNRKNNYNINNNYNKNNINSNNYNNKNISNTFNNNNNNNKKKTFRPEYTKIIGRGVSSELSAQPKQFYIYLGRLDISTTKDKVQNDLEKVFQSVKFSDNDTRDVKFSNLKELNENFVDRSFKSFSFSVSFLDKEIVKMKELFPLHSIVNQHKLSYAAWTAITQKYKNNPQNVATTAIIL